MDVMLLPLLLPDHKSLNYNRVCVSLEVCTVCRKNEEQICSREERWVVKELSNLLRSRITRFVVYNSLSSIIHNFITRLFSSLYSQYCLMDSHQI